MLRLNPWGEHHGQSSVLAATGFGADALDDFSLQHDVQIEDGGGRLQQMKQQWCRNVVRQVADDA